MVCLSADVTVLDVNPQGATPAYASPELLRSLQLHCQGFDVAEPGLLINGPSADWWAVGIVLFELLTRELPSVARQQQRHRNTSTPFAKNSGKTMRACCKLISHG